MVAPPPDLKISDWADQYRKLPKETSAEPGQWRTERAPYQRRIMDSINDPEVEKVVVMSSSQVGKSEIVINVMGYYIDVDPCPMLMIQPTIETAQDFSKRRIAPSIKAADSLREKVADSKSKSGNNTILMKSFPGGFLALGGANSPAGLASRPIRILLADEIDRYPESAGSEGDPLKLAEKRTTTFWNKKKVYVSTPTIKDASRIEDEYKKGTQEKWKLKCPHCGDYQYIHLQNVKFEYEKDKKGNYKVWDLKYECTECHSKFDEHTWKNQSGKWVAENDDVIKTRSFHLNAFVSPWTPWEEIIEEWLTVKKDPEQYKVFKNTMLGLPWEEKGEIEDEEFLLKRREEYEADVPDGVLLLTAGVDVQDDRLEYEIAGWGKGQESWGIEYGMIMGAPDMPSTWQMLSDKLDQTFRTESGKGMKVTCTCVDSGGHFTSDVYKFCKKNEHRRIFAIKGRGGPGIPLIDKIYRSKKENAAVFILGVDSGKSTIMSRLKIKERGDGYCHFPANKERNYDRSYFQGLISEKLVRRKRSGQYRMVWEKISPNQRNEPLDLRNYALAALNILNPSFDALEKRLKQKGNGSVSTSNSKSRRKKKRRGVVNKGVSV